MNTTTTYTDTIIAAVYTCNPDSIGESIRAVPSELAWEVRAALREPLSPAGQERIASTSAECHPSYDPRPWANREVMRNTSERAKAARARHRWAGRYGHIILHALAVRSGSAPRMGCAPDCLADRILRACGV